LAFSNRGHAYQAKGDVGRAILDFDEAIRLDPNESANYFNRAINSFYAGALSKAMSDLNQSLELDPKFAYAALWLHIVERRSNLPSHLAKAVTQIDGTAWPAPVVRLYLGQTTPEAVVAAAEDQNADIKKHRVCEAEFFAGELALQRGAKDEGVRLFRLVVANCPGNTARMPTQFELKTLGATP
jgi:lipoprotein NlpI